PQSRSVVVIPQAPDWVAVAEARGAAVRRAGRNQAHVRQAQYLDGSGSAADGTVTELPFPVVAPAQDLMVLRRVLKQCAGEVVAQRDVHRRQRQIDRRRQGGGRATGSQLVA